MIKGYKHLQECAYIGDDSSEELDELLEAYKLGLMTNTTLMEKIEELKKVDGKANDPGTDFAVLFYFFPLVLWYTNVFRVLDDVETLIILKNLINN